MYCMYRETSKLSAFPNGRRRQNCTLPFLDIKLVTILLAKDEDVFVYSEKGPYRDP